MTENADLGDAGTLAEIAGGGRYPDLDGKVVVVTGGASGIGAATAAQFAAQGARVAVIDRDTAPFAPVAAAIETKGWPQPLVLRCDLTDIAAAKAEVARVERDLGPVRVLVNNAARDDRHELAAVTPDYWDERFAVNLRHQFFMIQAVAPGMAAAGGGSIINMTSTSFMTAIKDLAVYQSAKSGVIGLTRGLARDLGPQKIRVNAIAPGWIMTARQRALWATPEALAAAMERQCLKETIRPADLARMVLFLASDDSRMCTCQTFIVDAGLV
jgi:NAD(P)-dependent dehydrogenase (short-subunit alcohol dehydrogenase family)